MANNWILWFCLTNCFFARNYFIRSDLRYESRIKLRERCCGWPETCNEFAERRVKQIWEGRSGLGKGSFCGLGVHLSTCIYFWWEEMSDKNNREGKHSGCLISPSLCSSSHALSIVRSTCCTPQVTTPRPCSSAPTVTLSPAWHPAPTCLPSFLPRALLPGLPGPQLTIARTIRIFRGIMTGLVKHSCPWKSLIFLAATQPVPRRAGSDRVRPLQRGTHGSAAVPRVPQPQHPAHGRGRSATALPSLWALLSERQAEFQQNARWLVCHSQGCHRTEPGTARCRQLWNPVQGRITPSCGYSLFWHPCEQWSLARGSGDPRADWPHTPHTGSYPATPGALGAALGTCSTQVPAGKFTSICSSSCLYFKSWEF